MLPRTSPATLSLSRSFRALPRFPAYSPTHPHNPPRPLPRFPGSPPLHPLAPSSLFPRLYGPLTSSPATLTSSPASSAPFPAFPHLPTFPHTPRSFPASLRTPSSPLSRSRTLSRIPAPLPRHPPVPSFLFPRLYIPRAFPHPSPPHPLRSKQIDPGLSPPPSPERRSPGTQLPLHSFHPSARAAPPSFLPPAADSSCASRRSPSSSSL